MPDGMSITNLKQRDAAITIEGEAQSNARVSSFMRKIEQSEWLRGTKLKIIKESKLGENKTVNSFTLTFQQNLPNANEEQEDEGS
jgi:type IV pilus assembly protein PilN